MQGFARPLAHAAHSRTISCWVVMHVWKMRVGLAHRQSVLGLDAAEGEKVGRIGLYSTIPIQYPKYYTLHSDIAIFVTNALVSGRALQKLSPSKKTLDRWSTHLCFIDVYDYVGFPKKKIWLRQWHVSACKYCAEIYCIKIVDFNQICLCHVKFTIAT